MIKKRKFLGIDSAQVCDSEHEWGNEVPSRPMEYRRRCGHARDGDDDASDGHQRDGTEVVKRLSLVTI